MDISISKSKADSIGKKIRELLKTHEEIPLDLIEQLQLFRSSYKNDLSAVTQLVYNIAAKGGTDSITSFRIKRIESILSKIKREPTMKLGNMGDIAGCRIMVYRDGGVQKVLDSIHSTLKVVSVNDYTERPKEDGYNGYHVYVESPHDPKRKLEIQVRSKDTHQWSSLVEIIDNIYELKIKEGQKHPDLQKFLLLLSNKNTLSIAEMKEVIELDKKHNVYGRLNEVFIKNYYRIRKEWLQLKSFENRPFFMFELREDKTSVIHSFDDYEKAEQAYFDKFIESTKSNLVLAHIGKPKFKSMCIAYASYVMIQHDYLDDWNKFTHSLMVNPEGLGSQINNIIEYSKRNLIDQSNLIQEEIETIKEYENDENVDVASLQEWKTEIEERVLALPGGILKNDNRKRKDRMSVFKWVSDRFNIG